MFRPNLIASSQAALNTALATLAEQELAARTAPIQGEVIGANPEGGVDVRTPSGGVIQAERLSDGPFDRRAPIQRTPGDQRAFADAPPAGVDLSAVWAAIDALQSRSQGATVSESPPGPADALFPGHLWLEIGIPPGVSSATPRLWIWEATAAKWHGGFRWYRGSSPPSFVQGAASGDHYTDQTAQPLALYLFNGSSWGSP